MPITIDCSGDLTLKAVASAGSADVWETASGALTLFHPTAAGTASIIHGTSGALALKPLALAGTATVSESASGALTLKMLELSGLASTTEIASGALALQPLTAAGTAIVKEIASGSFSLKAVTAAGTATVHEIASGALTLKSLSFSGSASVLGFPGYQIGEPELTQGVYVHRESAFTIVHSDRERLIVCVSAVAVAVTLPEAIGAFGRGFRTQLLNIGAGVVTISAAAGTINESSDPITLVTTDNVEFWSDGANWYAIESNYS